jgi:protein-S-isoprenylcysteine O-methyltransferase Ste14
LLFCYNSSFELIREDRSLNGLFLNSFAAIACAYLNFKVYQISVVAVLDELFFRTMFALIWAAFISSVIWLIYFSSGARKSARRTKERIVPENRMHIIALIIFAPIWWYAIISYIFMPGWIAFFSIALPEWFRIVIMVVATAGAAFTMWSYRTIGKDWVHAMEPKKFASRKRGALITTGPYKYVRNPIYLGLSVFVISMSLLAANWLLLVPSVALIIIVYKQVPNEERMLKKRFGKEYLEYMKRTPGIFPGIFRY